MNKILMPIFILILLVSSCSETSKSEVNLSSRWRIQFRDDPAFASADFDDSDWEYIHVPSTWEDEGFPGYDGYAWYRNSFRISKRSIKKELYVDLGLIHDVDEVYVNGIRINGSGTFPPNLEKVMNTWRRYALPAEHLFSDRENVIAVRVYNEEGRGGIVAGDIAVKTGKVSCSKYYLASAVDLSGDWKFRTGDNKSWQKVDLNDERWKIISVPGFWENQGYANYDGYAWYRRKVILPDSLMTDNLILALGKIDDIDEVYFNGEKIGATGSIPNNHSNRDDYTYWARDRFYYISPDILNWETENVIAVRVFDFGSHGGIFDGPIGIITQKEYLRHRQIVPQKCSD